jgi:hypothetical protein
VNLVVALGGATHEGAQEGAANTLACRRAGRGCLYRGGFDDVDAERQDPVQSGDFDRSPDERVDSDHDPQRALMLICLCRGRREDGQARWTMRWKSVINTFAITFGDRWPAAETY